MDRAARLVPREPCSPWLSCPFWTRREICVVVKERPSRTRAGYRHDDGPSHSRLVPREPLGFWLSSSAWTCGEAYVVIKGGPAVSILAFVAALDRAAQLMSLSGNNPQVFQKSLPHEAVSVRVDVTWPPR